ncbi:MAG: hypothetical protein H8E44_04315 [Planctomycetes bacterium]|nr:hypothetical protein [Planctomycetota bacterium]
MADQDRTSVMKIGLDLDWHQVRERLETFILSQVYQYWDYGMTLKEAEAEGADVPGMSKSPFGHPVPLVHEHVQAAVEETLDEHFEEGFPRGGCPGELTKEIRAHATGIMYESFGPPPSGKPKRRKRAR